MTPDEFWSILHTAPEPQPVFYRLYHDDQGRPLFYSMEDVPGTYIEIDQETFARSNMQVKVVNGQLVQVVWRTANKLCPSTHEGTRCHPLDVCIVVEDSTGQPWTKKTYEAN